MSALVSIVHIVSCVMLVIVVLLQSGKGAEISASFGGSSQTVFGSSGGANFFVKFTYVVATIFFCTSLVLTVLGGQSRKSLFEGAPLTTTTAPVTAPTGTAPATGATGAAH